MRNRLLPLSISLVAMLVSLLSLKLSTVPVHAATQPKYVTEVVVPGGNTVEDMPKDTQKAIQNALDKKAAEGWQLQTMTVLVRETWSYPVYVLAFKK